MRTSILIILLFVSIQGFAQEQITELVGRVEAYPHGDSSSIFIGKSAGLNAMTYSTSSANTFIGAHAGLANISGVRNTFLGTFAGQSSVASNNCYIGHNSGASNVSGGNNVFVGQSSGFHGTNLVDNVIIGTLAGFNMRENVGNVILGNSAGSGIRVGSRNLILGNGAGQRIEGDNNVIIGPTAGPSTNNTNASNRLYINEESSDDPLIYGEFDNDILRVNGDLQIATTGSDGNSRLRMKGLNGTQNEVIRYSGTNNDVVMGSVSGTGGKLFLRANANTRMAIIENGNIGIGTISPTQKLHVEGSAYVNGTVTTEGSIDVKNQLRIGNLASNGTTDLRISSIGVVAISSSDARLKEDIETLDSGLEKVLALRGVTFGWIADPDAGTQLGVIAQEVQKVVPEIVTKSGEYLGVDYSEMAALFIEAIKDQQAIIEDQQAIIEDLSSRLEKLEGVKTASFQD